MSDYVANEKETFEYTYSAEKPGLFSFLGNVKVFFIVLIRIL